MYYTYIHYTADTDEMFYVGTGKDKRFSETYNRSTKWKKVVEARGFRPVIMAYWKDEDEAYEHEEFLIDTIKKMGIKLVNKLPGGRWNGETNDRRTNQFGDNNVMKNPLIADKIRLSKLGKKRPDLTGMLNPMKDPVIANKVGNALRGRTHSEEWVSKYKMTMANKPLLKCKYCDFATANPGNITQHTRSKHEYSLTT